MQPISGIWGSELDALGIHKKMHKNVQLPGKKALKNSTKQKQKMIKGIISPALMTLTYQITFNNTKKLLC